MKPELILSEAELKQAVLLYLHHQKRVPENAEAFYVNIVPQIDFDMMGRYTVTQVTANINVAKYKAKEAE